MKPTRVVDTKTDRRLLENESKNENEQITKPNTVSECCF